MRIAPALVMALLVGGSVLAVRYMATGAPPAAAADGTLADGAALYKQHCATCHGDDGRGGGPEAAAMHFLPGDLTAMTTTNHGVFPAERARQIIEGRGPAVHGTRLMPVWGDVFTRSRGGRDAARQRIDAVVRFLESIQRRATD